MKIQVRLAPTAILLLAATYACSAERPEASSDGTWVGTITTEGNVTTVINESGSVWGGTAMLVEEASIGVESGPDEYMINWVTGVYADTERIYVAQPLKRIVRMYSFDGVFVGNLGGYGHGPGEFLAPVWVAGDSDGRRFVYDIDSRRIVVYAAGGEYANTVSVPNQYCCTWPMVVGPDDTVWASIMDGDPPGRDRDEARKGIQGFDASGPVGPALWTPEIEYPRLVYKVGGNREEGLPFAPSFSWAAGTDGIVAGASDRYRFQVLRADGSRLAVERYWDPVSIDPAHLDWARRLEIARARLSLDQEWNWDGEGIPTHQPAFTRFLTAVSGETWVVRRGASRQIPGCTEDPSQDYESAADNPCWATDWIIDAFGQRGRFLGSVERPPHVPTFEVGQWFIRGDLVLGVAEDEAGTRMLKRYRLVLPGGE